MAGQLGEEAEQLARLTGLARAFTDGLEPGEIIDLVISQGISETSADGGILAMVRPRGVLEVVAVVGAAAVASVDVIGRLTVDRGLSIAEAARTGTALFIGSQAEGRERFPELAVVAPRSHAWASIPLVSRDNVLGVFGLSFHAPRDFSESDRRYLLALADLSTLALSGRDPLRRSVNAVRRCRSKR